jgi:hypothetical protein
MGTSLDQLSAEELVGAYRRLEEAFTSAGYPQSEEGLLEAVADRVGHADAVSITEWHRGKFTTLAASNELAREGDQLQYRLDEGPCVAAVVEGEVFAPIDLASDQRWPKFGPTAASDLGLHSMVALRLISDVPDGRYGLNLFARRPSAFDSDDLLFCLLVGCFASSLVRTSKSRDVIMNLEKALASNREIGIAVGIIMSTHKLTAERSFELLRRVSMNSNRKVSDVAARIVLTGTLELDRPLPA